MTIQNIVEQHAAEAAFLWTTRSRAATAPHYSLKTLATLDDRVEAHLDGLRIAGKAGWSLCEASLEHPEDGGVFPLAVLAFEAADRQQMLVALTAGSISANTKRALVSALGWLEFRSIEPAIRQLLKAKLPAHRAVGVAACAIQRIDPGSILAAAVDDPDPALRARSLRAVGELKRHDLVNPVRAHLTDEDEGCRFWASWTSTLYGDAAGRISLMKWLGRDDAFGQTALQLALRALDIERGRERIRLMAKDPTQRRSAVTGAGILGDPTTVPWLIGHMDSPGLARLAGEAFSMITGVDLGQSDLDRAAPPEDVPDDPSAADPAREEDSQLPWPRQELVDAWWKDHRGEFRSGSRYFVGQPLSVDAARQVLVGGKQRQRAAAAIELALREPDERLFEVRGRARRQSGQLPQVDAQT